MQIVTVPGGNGVTIAIPFADSNNAMAATALLAELYQAALSQQHIVDASSGSANLAAIPGDVNALIDDISGTVPVPVGYQYLVDDFKLHASDPYPVGSFIAGGDLDGSMLDSESDQLHFTAGTGILTIVAGAGDFILNTLQNGAGGGVIDLDGFGTEMISLASGGWNLTTGLGPAAVTLGSGSDTVSAEGPDTIFAGTGIANILLDAGDDVVHGGAGVASFTAGGTDDTIYAGAGRETVFGTSTGLSAIGSGAEIEFIDQTGGDSIVGNTSGLVVFGDNVAAGDGSTYQAPDNYFIFIARGAIDTINAAAGSQGPVVFGAAGGSTEVNAAAPGTFFAAGDGSETVDASGSTIGGTFFAGTGADDLIGSSTGSNFYGASSGFSTMSGGIGNVYDFTNGAAGGVDVISSFGAYDGLYLFGYGTDPQSGIAFSSDLNGVLNVFLTDGTRIEFENISSLASIQAQIHHG